MKTQTAKEFLEKKYPTGMPIPSVMREDLDEYAAIQAQAFADLVKAEIIVKCNEAFADGLPPIDTEIISGKHYVNVDDVISLISEPTAELYEEFIKQSK